MKTYNKRVAFLISAQHMIPHGGIGSFCKSFFEMGEELDWCVDIILDKQPKENILTSYLQSKGAKFFYPKNSIDYTEHNNTFVFSDGFNLEKSTNFRKAIMRSLETNLYDMIVINTPEAGLGVYDLNLQDKIPVVFYTHNQNIIFLDTPAKVFNISFNEITKNIMCLDDMVVGTQSSINQQALKTNFDGLHTELLPMRIPEQDLLKTHNIEKDGVLFTGRWEKGKNPEFFVKTIAKTGLKAKVLTNENGKQKFEKAFKDHGIENYDIRAGIIGEEKVEFIKSAKVAFHPSLLESYGFSAFETLHSCPTYALEEPGWWKNFEGYIRTTSKNNAAQDLIDAHNEEVDESAYVEKMLELHETIAQKWNDLMIRNEVEKKKPKHRSSIVSHFETHDETITLKHWYYSILKRTTIGIDDVHSVLNRRDMLNTWHTRDSSFIGVKDEFDVQPEETIDSLFI